jgi:hypothetical protein
MKYVLVLTLLVLSACSGPQIKRNLETDPVRRIFIDPKIDVAHYTEIRRALVQTGKFEVVDRSEAFEAAFREQELQHAEAGVRFSDKEKWSWVGEFYGAAAVIQANASCWQSKNFWGTYKRYCRQTLSLIDTSTGVVMFSVVDTNSIPWTVEWVVPDWDDVVDKATDAYPEYFKPRIVKAPLQQYIDQSEERAKREREKRLPATSGSVPPSVQRGMQMLMVAQAQEQLKTERDLMKELDSTDLPLVRVPQKEHADQSPAYHEETPPKETPKNDSSNFDLTPRAKDIDNEDIVTEAPSAQQ